MPLMFTLTLQTCFIKKEKKNNDNNFYEDLKKNIP